MDPLVDLTLKGKYFIVIHNSYNCRILFVCWNCRFEAFNSLLRAKNVFSNWLAPSRDIAIGFAIIGQLRSICSGGVIETDGPR